MKKASIMDQLIWQYFLALESDLESISRYIEINIDNYKVYSAEISKVLICSAMEFESLSKKLIKHSCPDKKSGNIGEIKGSLLSLFPYIGKCQVILDRPKICLNPFYGWENNNLEWWDAYGDIKHDRIKNYFKANLKNCINALAALGVINIYYYKVMYGFEHLTGTKMMSIAGMGELLCAKPSIPIPDSV
jgi:hypothetical protein